MATPSTTTSSALREQERASARKEQRVQLREAQLQRALQELSDRHEEERQALSKELWELAAGRKDTQERLWAVQEGLIIPRSSQQEDGAPSTPPPPSTVAVNGKQGFPGEGGKEIPYCARCSSKARDQEKQELLKELLPAKSERHVEVRRLLEVLDEKELRNAYDYRIRIEDPREIRARQRTLATTRGGLWPWVSKKKGEAESELNGTAQDDIDFVDYNRLGKPRWPECYEEIKKLLDIEKNPIFSAALEEWTRKEELYSRRVERLKSRVDSLKNEVYQSIGFFSVFQGVVLTAVSQSSFLYCHNKWSPIALSVLASVISTLAVIQKLNQIKFLQKNIDEEEREIKTAVKVGQLLREPGSKGINFSRLNKAIEIYSDRKSAEKSHLLIFMLVILTLVAFGVLFPVSFWRILCKPGSPPGQ